MNYIKLLKNSIGILVISLLLTSCATSYRNIQPNHIKYNSKIITDSLEIGYSYNVMKRAGNKKQVNKSTKKNLNVLAIEIKNKSNKTINFEKDIHLSTSQGEIILIDPLKSYKILNQAVLPHLLWMFGAQYNEYPNGESEFFVGINLYGAFMAIPNMIIAERANRQLKAELYNYSAENLVIAPNETEYGLISFYGQSELNIFLDRFKNFNILKENTIYESPFRYDTKSIFYLDSNKSVDEYCKWLEKYLRKDDNFRELNIQKQYYYNGKLKSIGVISHHESLNNNYLNNIGTWHYYYDNGQLKEVIDYNYQQEYHGRLIKYDRNGTLINQDEYKNNRRIK